MNFFDELFSGKVIWSMHTAMTCDKSFVYALIKKQLGEKATYKEKAKLNCAFFYEDKPEKNRTITCKMRSPSVNIGEVSKYIHPLQDSNKTHHAKISLVCYEDEKEGIKYRLAVYSRNLEFSQCVDSACLFVLKIGETETESGKQLISYLKKIKEITDNTGKKWFSQNITNELFEQLKKATLIDKFNNEAELFFGGLENEKEIGYRSLGELIALNDVEPDSIVLTPPEFVRRTSAQKFFLNRRMLFDHKEKPSHLKLYLIHRKDCICNELFELWLGSANATAHGLGWDFESFKKSKASIECLVKRNINKSTFDKLSREIKQDYNPFDFNEEGSLKINPDVFGPYIVQNYSCIEVTYVTKDNKKNDYSNTTEIQFVLECQPESNNEEIAKELIKFDKEDCIWRPLEYFDDISFGYTINDDDNNSITIIYKVEKFRPSQQMLVFGKSCAVMEIPENLIKEVPKPKDKLVKENMLSDWIYDEASIPGEREDNWEEGLKWCYDTITEITEKSGI